MIINTKLVTWQNLKAPEQLRKDLVTFDFQNIASQHINKINRIINNYNLKPTLRIALLSNFVLDMLPPYIKAIFFGHGFDTECYLGSYNQYFQEVLREGGGLTRFSPDMVFLFLTMKDLEPEIAECFSRLTTEERKLKIDEILKHIKEWTHAARERTGAMMVISNFPLPVMPQLGVADLADPVGEIFWYNELNSRLAMLAEGQSDIQILDIARLVARYGADNVYDPKLYYLARMMWCERFFPLVAHELLRIVIAVKGTAKKCLTVDLDNTLWGGVIGEDGPHGVKIGVGDPLSEAFRDFQLRLRTLKDCGIMLAICSKNNEDDVRDMFEVRKDMPLNLGDFAAVRINWQNKAQNIREIAAELNIGLDSVVFIDDNPAECAIVNQILPEVVTVHLPPHPEVYPSIVDQMPFFEKRVILTSDKQKTAQYAQNRKREALQATISDLGIYLQSLETEVDIRRPRIEDMDRLHQLFSKTNQFNVTTIRYSPAEIKSFCENTDTDLLLVSAADKFGDLGIIGLYLLRLQDDKTAQVDSFILSCRAMGRGIGTAIMNHLKQYCFKKLNLKEIIAQYIPTKKNTPVETFFEKQGFMVNTTLQAGAKHYRLKKSDSELKNCSWIGISGEDE